MFGSKTIGDLTFAPFAPLQAPPRSPAPIRKGEVIVGYRNEAERGFDERVRAVGDDPEILAVLKVAHAKFLADERAELEKSRRMSCAAYAARQAKAHADARAALFPNS